MSERAEVIRGHKSNILGMLDGHVVTIFQRNDKRLERSGSNKYSQQSTYLAVMSGVATYWGHLHAVTGIVKRSDAERPMTQTNSKTSGVAAIRRNTSA